MRAWTRRDAGARLWAVLGAIALVASVLVAVQVPTPARSAGDPCGAGSNPIVCENSKPGTDPDEWDIQGAGDPTIQGFATDISVNAGSKIDFKIDTDAKAYGITIYRTGWYQGLGARKIATVAPSASLPQTQPECISDETTELYDCGTWKVSATWDVPAEAVSGVYVALLRRNDNGGVSHIIFIVRNDGNTSDVVFQTSDPTWEAYNTYGGSDYYQGNANGRAYKISYNRPFSTRGWVNGRDFYFSSEYATVRFLERNGYDVSYLAGVDSDRRGGELLKHKVFLSVGHDEYWSAGQRKNVEAARDAGVNLQFLSGNEVYWHTRYEDSADGSNTPYRTLTSYKETWGNGANPGGAKIDPSAEWTGTWRDPRFADASEGGHLPENQLTGTMYMVNDDDLPVTVTAAEGRTRLWRNTSLTSLAAGTSAPLAAHTVGYESDEDVDNGMRPQGLIRLSTTVGPTPQYLTDYGNVTVAGTTEHHLTLYRAPSGALVFGAGTVQWGWGLDQEHDGDGAPADARMQQAQVNLLADMGAQPGTLMTGLRPATKSTDAAPPTTTITSPTAGDSIAHGSKVTVKGTASDAAGVVAGVEVSTDGGDTWHPATGTTSWSYTYVQQGNGTAEVIARAIDDSANYAKAGTSVSVKVTGSASVFGQETPPGGAADDSSPVELGLRFTPKSDGYVSGVRFYKATGNTGTHTGSLWDATGQRLATVTFTNETATGWQQAKFDTPVEVFADTGYTVSYSAPNGHYVSTDRYWPYENATATPVDVTPGLGADSPGVFGTIGTRPTGVWHDTNYSVDVLFDKVDGSPLRITSSTPVAGSSSNDPTAPLAVTFSRAVDPSTLQLSVKASDGTAVAGATSLATGSKSVTFTPASALKDSTTYTVSVVAKDTNGVALASGTGSWTFITAEATRDAGDCPCSLRTELSRPDVASAADTDAVTLGVRFSTVEDGTITALRFYKGPGNSGAHTATLWSAGGTALAAASFTDEPTQGWVTAKLDTPVKVTAGSSYVASYTAPNGGYAVSAGAFATSYARGPLSVPANGAVYSYSGGFPQQVSASDYGVDVVMTQADPGPVVTSVTPQDGAANVATGSTVTASFDSKVTAATLKLTDGGQAVQGTTALAGDGTSVTFTPSSPLPAGTTLGASLSGVTGATGVAGAETTWSFTTAPGAGATATTFFSGTPQASTATDDPDAVILGMHFSTSSPGAVAAIRFYKATGNTGTHVGWLWGPDSTTPLAQVTFSSETATGWQRAKLSTPVQLDPGTQYTVSYLAPHGNYSYAPGGFTTPLTSGTLTAPSSNGLYRYGTTGMPITVAGSGTNYFVDVEFVTTGGSYSQTLFGAATPGTVDSGDSDATEVGTAFTVAERGKVTALRFYKAAANTGTHVGTLWGPDGTALAHVTFTGESASGWQSAQLDTPVTVQPGTTYVASYLAPNGHYSAQQQYFTADRVSGRITGPGTDNGRYLYGTNGGYPTQSYKASAYFVDAVVSFGDDAATSSAPVSSSAPAPGSSAPATSSSVAASRTAPASTQATSAPTSSATSGTSTSSASSNPTGAGGAAARTKAAPSTAGSATTEGTGR